MRFLIDADYRFTYWYWYGLLPPAHNSWFRYFIFTFHFWFHMLLRAFAITPLRDFCYDLRQPGRQRYLHAAVEPCAAADAAFRAAALWFSSPLFRRRRQIYAKRLRWLSPAIYIVMLYLLSYFVCAIFIFWCHINITILLIALSFSYIITDYFTLLITDFFHWCWYFIFSLDIISEIYCFIFYLIAFHFTPRSYYAIYIML